MKTQSGFSLFAKGGMQRLRWRYLRRTQSCRLTRTCWSKLTGVTNACVAGEEQQLGMRDACPAYSIKPD